MADLAQLLHDTMRRQRLDAQALADRTGIRTPRIRVFAQEGATGPICPTEQELRELALALALPLPTVLDAAGPAPAGAPS
ncbi:XRE family transcriptional regulator [Streptomyces sp. SID10815]|uniref:XRE family transcriptional regulator n=1 Tax=Streptomyces similanensis TaxID=1274988 RepID=A0ABP9KT80_9ACTN|nr:XRE family transcriptional regulator [Streptomyces sp. SID10815]NEA46727.1 XRE family transcriptional regulator [Streptomyces sp. SID10815]QKW25937.1 XRE family transcriptional regulator [Streptomyces seoulensis]